jgi:hypothetical protein
MLTLEEKRGYIRGTSRQVDRTSTDAGGGRFPPQPAA